MLMNYWINPYGEYFPVSLMGHCEWSNEYVNQPENCDAYEKWDDEHFCRSTVDYLIEKLGWKKCMQWSIDSPFKCIPDPMANRWPKKQLDAIWNIHIDHEEQISDSVYELF